MIGFRIALATALAGALSIYGAMHGADAEGEINTVHEIHAALRACWMPPNDGAPTNIQVTIRVSFTRTGEVLGQPLITYESPNAYQDERDPIRAAVAATLKRCSPLPLSASLGEIIAGHPINVRLGEGWRRKEKAGGSN
jgi:hypothetical protein